MPRFLDGFLSLGKDINRTDGEVNERQEGIVGERVSELSLNMDDKELISLSEKWSRKWNESKVKREVEAKQKENERYWLGDHYTPAQKKAGIREAVDNLIFETLETFLPVATRQIAQPNIKGPRGSEEFTKKVTDRIVEVADVIRLRLKVKKAVRYWALYFLGVLWLGWSKSKNEIAVETLRPQELIFDPEAITDECEYKGEYIGRYRTETASDLAERFKEKAKEIREVAGKEGMGTKIRYIEWWTNDYVFWTLKKTVLGKAKNPHWNYNTTEMVETVMLDGETPTFEEQTLEGRNHFSSPKIPVAFLSVFSIGKGPFDNTNLIEQVLPLQDIVNKRVRQIDKNADNTNSGIVVSGDFFSPEQAAEAARRLRKGQAIRVPTGDVNKAYKRDVGPPLPEFIYKDSIDKRDEIRSIFGTTGLTPQGIEGEDTVRGKIIVRGQDADRAALVVDHIEQMYDYIFNWMVQLMMVYYDTPREVSRAQGTETIISDEFVYPLVVSVKEGSLIPKDRLTQRNEAVDLWTAGAIDPLTLAERLEVPDPKEYVKRLIAWKLNPAALLEGGQEQAQPIEPVEQQVPLENIPIE